MDKELYLVFEGDEWLSTDSLVPMGVYDDEQKAVNAIIKEMTKAKAFDKDHTKEYVKKYLEENGQTPCLDTNYIIKQATLNVWEEI